MNSNFFFILTVAVNFYLNASASNLSKLNKCLKGFEIGTGIVEDTYQIAKGPTDKFLIWNEKSVCEFTSPPQANGVSVSIGGEKVYFSYRQTDVTHLFKRSTTLPLLAADQYVSGNSSCGTKIEPSLAALLDKKRATIKGYSPAYFDMTRKKERADYNEKDLADRNREIEKWRSSRLTALTQCQGLGSKEFQETVEMEINLLKGKSPSAAPAVGGSGSGSGRTGGQ